MKCEICGADPSKENVTLHRVNEKGVIGVWRCDRHITHDQALKVDPIVADICKIIKQDNRTR